MADAPSPVESVCPVAWKVLVSPTFDGFDEASTLRMKALFMRDLRVLPSRLRALMGGECRELETTLHNLKSTTGYLRDTLLSQRCADVLGSLRSWPSRRVDQDHTLVVRLEHICNECERVTRALAATAAIC